MKKKLLLLYFVLGCLFLTTANNLQLYQAGKKAFTVGLYSIALDNLHLYLESNDMDKRVEALYLSGISAYYLNKYKDSLSYFWGIEQEFKNSVYINKILYWSGLNYYYLNEFSNATLYFSKYTKMDNQYKDISQLFNALSYIQLNNNEKAIESLERIVNSLDSEDRYKEEAIYRIGTLYLGEGNVNKSLNYFNQIVLDYPYSKFYNDSLSILADSYFYLEEWLNAKRAYLLLKDIDGNKDIFKKLATISLKLNNIEQSISYLEYYCDNYGKEKDVLYMLGDLYNDIGNILKSIEQYKYIDENYRLESNEYNENNYRIGSHYYKLKMYLDSFEYFSKVETKDSLYFTILSGLQINKDILSFIYKINKLFYGDKFSIDVSNRYINYLKNNSTNNNLESYLEYLTQKYPNNIEYSLSYGELLLNKNKLDESLKFLSKGLNTDNTFYFNIIYKIGWIYYNKGEYVRAIDYFNKIPIENPEYNKTLYSKSIALYKLGRLDEGKNGFLELIDLKSEYTPEISFYLGLIEKDNYNYKKAIEYLTNSLDKKTLYKDSMENIAWCYYHLTQYKESLDIYRSLWDIDKNDNYKFNIANCYYNLGDLEKSLSLYVDLTETTNKFLNSSYFKTIEILFELNKIDEAIETATRYKNSFPNSELPASVVLNFGDSLLYSNKLDESLSIYNKVLDIFVNSKTWFKARNRAAECYSLLGKYKDAIDNYLHSIKENDEYKNVSTKSVILILNNNLDPTLTLDTKKKIDSLSEIKSELIPIYIECFKQGVFSESSLNEIDSFIQISRTRDEINSLIYLRALESYKLGNIDDANDSLKNILSRPEVSDLVKVDAILLQSQILNETGYKKESIDLYLNLYVNYPNLKEKAALALYKGYIISKELNDTNSVEKILNILKTEYSSTIWGERVISEN